MTVATSYRSTSLRRSILPSPLASAIVGSLLMAATLPALAQGNTTICPVTSTSAACRLHSRVRF